MDDHPMPEAAPAAHDVAGMAVVPHDISVPLPAGKRTPARSGAYKIPFNRPTLCGNEYDYIAAAVSQGHISGDGPYTRKCQAMIDSYMGGHSRSLLTTSCTHALEMAALLLDIKQGDEVIVPSFTFVSTANAFALRGAKLVFADIRTDTLNIDETKLEGLITPKTRAIVPVHYAGVGCEMDAILGLAKKHGLFVVEDNAHGLFARYNKKPLGTFGNFATQSFHETKNFQCGEGGALLINDPAMYAQAEMIREKGTNRSEVFRGEANKYTWKTLGSSYVPSDLLAAFLLAQLESAKQVQAKRRDIWRRYDSGLRDWAQTNGVRQPTIPANCDQAYHLYYLVMPSPAARSGLIAHLKSLGILAVFHYLPLHLSPMGLTYGGKQGDCPVCESVSDCLLRLPFFNSLDHHMQDQVIDAILRFSAN